jgi:UDP-glucose 4-epimerase
MRILVAGGAGFIGSHLCDELLRRGHSITCVDDLSAGSLDNLRDAREHPDFEFVKLDVTHEHDLMDVGDGHEVVVNLVAKKIPRYTSALSTLETNIRSTHATIELARHMGAKYVLASTSDVYGRSPKLPFSEDDDLLIGTSTSRRWAYAASKLYDEHLCFAYQDEFALRCTMLRFFGAYGERQYLSWWGGPQGVFLEAIANGKEVELHGDGRQTRCFIFVNDLVNAVANATERSEADGQIINVGTDEEVSIADLARMMHRLSGEPGELRVKMIPYETLSTNYQDVMRRIPDLTKMHRILGGQSYVRLEEGLSRLWAWYRRRGSAQRRAPAPGRRRLTESSAAIS